MQTEIPANKTHRGLPIAASLLGLIGLLELGWLLVENLKLRPCGGPFTRIELTTNAETEISSFVKTASSGSSNQREKARCGGAKGQRSLKSLADTGACF